MKGSEFKIYIDLNGDDFGEVDYYYITRQKEFYNVRFTNCRFYKNGTLKKGDVVGLRASLDPSYISVVDVFEKVKLDDKEAHALEIKASLDSFLQLRYSTFYLKLARSLYNNEDLFDWRLLSNIKKKVWLDVCSSWSGVQTTFSPGKPVVLDFKNINSELDLFCYLGESFFGKYGYLGKNLDALIDCLRSFVRNSTNNSLVFKHFSHLQNVLDTEKNFKKYGEKYSKIVVAIFEQCNFTIKYVD